MRRSAQITFLLRVLCLPLSLALPAVAGQFFPCPRAVSSSNGNFLVLTDVQLEHGQGNTAKVQRVSLQVFPKEHFINAKDRLATPGTYWTAWLQWDVVLDSMPMHNEPECPMPLISDNGEFMVLLHLGILASGEDAVMQIYRWNRRSPDHHGAFVKDIALKEIWKTPGRLGQNVGSWTDQSPEWFAGGTFEFSSDSRQLIHETRFGNTVRINLQDGSVSGN